MSFPVSACRSLPVLMYHYISRYRGSIAVSPETFEAHCRGMAEAGWRGVGLDEAEAFFLEGAPLPARSALITFDDGFLDNYVYAWPILKKYGHKGVVFAVTRRLGTDGAVRPTLEDVWSGRIAATDLPPVDAPMRRDELGHEQRHDLFLSWEEARRMEASGVMAVAAHTATHHAIYAAPIFPGPGEGARVRTPRGHGNTFYIVDGPTPWGLPLFRERPAMHSRAFLPSPRLLDLVQSVVPQGDERQAHAFFQNPANVERLMARIDALSPEELGAMESDEAREARIRSELSECAATLARELGHPVRSLCWPWGRGSDVARAEARKLGFSVFFETRMGANPPGASVAVRRFKARDKSRAWLRLRLALYSRPWLAGLYARARI